MEESDTEAPGAADLQAVTSYLTDVAGALLPHRRIGLMHGKLKPKEKAAVMDQFKNGELDVLVSTTVIEVGVDVPNATVMVIENAERYGLSALHQLRGRVGRGGGEAYCILISDHTGEAVRDRLRFLCHTQDGFEIAKYDLETRGPGDFFGDRQHGLPTLQLADLMGDTRTLEAARNAPTSCWSRTRSFRPRSTACWRRRSPTCLNAPPQLIQGKSGSFRILPSNTQQIRKCFYDMETR